MPWPLPWVSLTLFRYVRAGGLYLEALSKSWHAHLQAVTKHGVVIRCFAPPGKSRQGLFALDTAVKVCIPPGLGSKYYCEKSITIVVQNVTLDISFPMIRIRF